MINVGWFNGKFELMVNLIYMLVLVDWLVGDVYNIILGLISGIEFNF